ncbi:hypothetical protein AB0M50_54475 [Nonomuraea fuscirosea]|uniref:hypothetical protein n=1 Tax=Nonomuraea fuscirosea TaxID=1291556 RepID=UPI00343C7B5D
MAFVLVAFMVAVVVVLTIVAVVVFVLAAALVLVMVSAVAMIVSVSVSVSVLVVVVRPAWAAGFWNVSVVVPGVVFAGTVVRMNGASAMVRRLMPGVAGEEVRNRVGGSIDGGCVGVPRGKGGVPTCGIGVEGCAADCGSEAAEGWSGVCGCGGGAGFERGRAFEGGAVSGESMVWAEGGCWGSCVLVVDRGQKGRRRMGAWPRRARGLR